MHLRTAMLLAAFLIAARTIAAPHCATQTTDGVPVTTCTAGDERFAAIRAEMLELVRTGEISSVSVAVVSPAGLLWKESFGWTDRERKTRATPSTPCLLASLGKSITATAVMRLVEHGAIDPDVPVARYLGEARLTVHEGRSDAVTVRRLLDMTAAIPHANYDFSSLQARREYSTPRIVQHRGAVVFPAGEVSLYSNASYAVLEQVIEHVTGKPYEQFLREGLFGPLRMTNSWVGRRHQTQESPAVLYDREGRPVPLAYSLPESSLSMYASVDDLVQYARLHLKLLPNSSSVMRHDTIDAMHEHRSSAPNAVFGLGLGRVELDRGRLFLLANGRAAGAQSALAMLEHEQIAAICLINTTGNRADELTFRMLDAAVPGFLSRFEQKRREYEEHNGPAEFVMTPDLIGEWRGTVVTSRGEEIPLAVVFQADGDVHITVGRQLKTLITGLRYEEGLLRGAFIADIPAEEQAGHPHRVDIALRRSEAGLSGFVTSRIANARGVFALPSYVRLQRQK